MPLSEDIGLGESSGSYTIAHRLFEYDRKLCWERKVKHLIGVDEAGRGPLAGPVYVAAVILSLDEDIEGLNDSKKVPEPLRYKLAPIIKEKAIYQVVSSSAKEIDKAGILNVVLHLMGFSASNLLENKDALVLVDGNQLIPTIPKEKQITIVKGDATSASIAAASILAKTSRDIWIVNEAKKYPNYEFDKHKGYGTKSHIELIKKYGLSEIHRRSFCRNFVPHEPTHEAPSI